MELTVYAIDGVIPVIHPDAFVHPRAVLIGDIIVGPGCYIGPLASLRGDIGRIRIGEGANVQDCCVLHSFPRRELIIEKDGHIGHGAVLHGCYIRRNALVGMNSVVMDGAELGENSILAAHSFVKAGLVLPPGSLIAGAPAKVIRSLTPEEIAWKRSGTAEYQHLARRSRATMKACAPLAEVDADRPELKPGDAVPLYQTR
jgi:phenylacetic acid degradation protein